MENLITIRKKILNRRILIHAALDSLRKLDPRVQIKNPVMFVVFVGSILTTILWVQSLVGQGEAPAWFIFSITIWLWFTVLFANFARQWRKAEVAHRRRVCARHVARSSPES